MTLSSFIGSLGVQVYYRIRLMVKTLWVLLMLQLLLLRIVRANVVAVCILLKRILIFFATLFWEAGDSTGGTRRLFFLAFLLDLNEGIWTVVAAPVACSVLLLLLIMVLIFVINGHLNFISSILILVVILLLVNRFGLEHRK